MTRHEHPYIHQYYHYNGQPRETVLTDIAEADAAVEQEMEEAKQPHRALGRRQRIRAIDHFYKIIPVARGTQQATAMQSVRETARVLAVTIEERCPEGVQKEHALRAAAEAMFWANQAISHR